VLELIPRRLLLLPRGPQTVRDRALGSVVVVLLAVAIPFSRRYGPELARCGGAITDGDDLALGTWTERCTSTSGGRERSSGWRDPGTVFVTFFNPRKPIPTKLRRTTPVPIQGGSCSAASRHCSRSWTRSSPAARCTSTSAGDVALARSARGRRAGGDLVRPAATLPELPLRDRIPAATPRARGAPRGPGRAVPLRLRGSPRAFFSRSTSSTFTGPPWLTRSGNCEREVATRLTAR